MTVVTRCQTEYALVRAVQCDRNQLARLLERSVASVDEELTSLPQGIYGVALLHGSKPVAFGILIDREIETRRVRSLARTVVSADAGPEVSAALVAKLEGDSRSRGVRTQRVSVIRAPLLAPVLEGAGYQPVESFLQFRLQGGSRPVLPLPDGLRECRLDEVGIPAYLELVNHVFEGMPGTVPLTLDDWPRITDSPRHRDDLIRIVVDGDRPVAFLRGSLPHEEHVAEVEVIGVHSSARRRGLGRWLLRRCEELLRAHGADPIELVVVSANESARDLYLAEGYVEVSRRDTWQRELHDAGS